MLTFYGITTIKMMHGSLTYHYVLHFPIEQTIQIS